MAQSEFFMTRDDGADFVSFLIDRFSAEFVPERSVDPPPFPRYTSLAGVEARVDADVCGGRYSRFAVLSPKWETLPLVISEIHANDGQHFFTLCHQYGGPAFDLLMARAWADGGRQWIVAGSFLDYPYYIADKAFVTDHSLYRSVQRPEAMSDAHKEVRSYLRRDGCRSVCRETGHPGPWIMRGALREHAAGLWLRGGDWHFDPKAGRRASTRRG